jgi:hypothetical protein
MGSAEWNNVSQEWGLQQSSDMISSCILFPLEMHEDIPDQQPGPGMSAFGTKKDATTVRRILFDRKLLIHATNSIGGIIYEIPNATGKIQSQRSSESQESTRVRINFH